jgi:hypothetical protein
MDRHLIPTLLFSDAKNGQTKSLDWRDTLRYSGAVHTPGRCLSASLCLPLLVDLAQPHEFALVEHCLSALSQEVIFWEASLCESSVRHLCP